jgi:hypothetical protein
VRVFFLYAQTEFAACPIQNLRILQSGSIDVQTWQGRRQVGKLDECPVREDMLQFIISGSGKICAEMISAQELLIK